MYILSVPYQNSNFPKTLFSRTRCLKYLGHSFRPVLQGGDSDLKIGEELLYRFILVHIDGRDPTTCRKKFDLLIFMARKLYDLVASKCCVDNSDAAQNQELLLPGSLYVMFLKKVLHCGHVSAMKFHPNLLFFSIFSTNLFL